MSSLKRIGVILLVAIVLIAMSTSFVSNDILNRAIIIGLGLDLSEDNQLVVTAEVVSPGNGSEQVGTFSKTITVTGQTIAHAIQQISQQMGKEASLGQCALLVLGKSLYTKVDFSQIVDFFIHSYNFKESSAICCAKGEAKELLNYGEAMSQSASLAVIAMLQQQSQSVGLPTNSLLQYARSQKELSCTGFTNYVEFVPSANTDSQNPNKTQGYFAYKKLVVFRKNKFVCTLDEQHLRALSLLTEEVSGDVFIVEVQGEKLTFIVSKKKVDLKIVDQTVQVDVQLKCRLARTDDFGLSGNLTVQTDEDIPQDVLDKLQLDAQKLLQDFVAFQQQNNVDLMYMHERYRQKLGTNTFTSSFAMDQIAFDISVKVKQN